MNRFILTIVVLITIQSCKPTQIKQDENTTIINNSKNLYAFVGKKISVIEFDPNNPMRTRFEIDSITNDTLRYESYVMDNGFNCKYIVKQNLYNQIQSDTVEFKAYDHYGRPGFEDVDNVIIYLSKDDDGNFFHRKYQHENLYLNSNGKYFSIPQFLGKGYLEVANMLPSFELKNFDKVKYNVSGILINDYNYPKDYYRIENDFAYPTKGMLLSDIIEFRIQTTFKDL